MATTVIEQPEPTIVQKVTAKVDRNIRSAILLVVAAAVIAMAPFPFASLGAAALVALAFEHGRRR